jgi:flavin-dependent dehydrogenase
LEELGVPLSQMNLPVIKKLIVTAPNGNKLQQDLPLGGFGISRFKLDHLLFKLASLNGVKVMEETKVIDVNFANDIFYTKYATSVVSSKIVAGTFGKRSNLDIKWKRKFVLKKSNKLNNYVGIKYHVKAWWPTELIGLHNFKNGYCGISQIEDDRFCLCYLTAAKNLIQSDNSIPELEKNILSKNPWLKKIFSEAQFLYQSPLTISQISFEKKFQVHDHILMIGDAAGMITPLCGNGMSMALHASKIAFEQIDLFLKNKISRSQMEKNYIRVWKKQFNQRLRTGRIIQRFFGSQFLSNLFIFFLKPFPFLTQKLIQQTHGEPI